MRNVIAVLLLGFSCAAPPPAIAPGIARFEASATTVENGGSIELSWAAVGVKECTLQPGLGTVAAESSMVLSPPKSTTYTLSCGGLSQTLTITVRDVVKILSFTATPAQALQEDVVTLQWATSGATTCTLLGDAPLAGSLQVSPSETTTYQLVCQGYPKAVRQSLVVSVSPAMADVLAVPTDVSFTPQDGQLSLSWVQAHGAANVYFAAESGFDASTIASKREGVVFAHVHSPLVVTGLVNGVTYYARVSTVSAALETALSPEVSEAPVGQRLGDPYFSKQWHLTNPVGSDIHAPLAWQTGVRGEGVLMAVVDEGVDLGHEDLSHNVMPLLSHDYLDGAPLQLAEHGTAVAGLLCARDENGVGVRGVAPRGRFVSYNVLQDVTSEHMFDAMTRHEVVVGVSNNSWGDEDGTGYLTTSDSLWLAGVIEGTRAGRHGLGTLYFWASGNGADSKYADLSNYDGQANRRYVFAVSGVGYDGVAAAYSEPGANVLVAAPTEGNTGPALTTTDITGAAGYNNGTRASELPNANYSQTMNGTSGATPVAAGVGALVLQVRPELSWRDVRRVLAYSARQTDPTDPDWSVNGAGLHINPKYGYGTVDAEAAVRIARTISLVGPEVTHSTDPHVVQASLKDDGTPVVDTFTVSGSGISKLEFVEIYVTLDHERTGDVELTLTHSNGANDVLQTAHACMPDPANPDSPCSEIVDYPFGSTRHIDEPADGEWTLTARDLKTGATGQLVSWHLSFYGSTP